MFDHDLPRLRHDMRMGLVAVVIALLTPIPVPAADGDTPLPADPTLARLIEESLAARPELARAEAMLHAERGRVHQVAALPDPTLQIQMQNDGFEQIEIGNMEQSWVSFMAAQTFPWPGKRGLRADVAELGAAQAGDALKRVRLSTEAEVRRAYLELMLVRDRLALHQQVMTIWDKSLGLARSRYETGVGAQSDVLRSQLEINRVMQRHFGLEAEEAILVQALNRLRNRPLNEPLAVSGHIRELTPLATLAHRFSIQQSLERSPELAAARQGITRAQRSVELAEKSYYPDLTLGAGVMVRGDLPPMWLVSVGGPIPAYAGQKQNHLVAEMRATATAAQRDVDILEQTLQQRSAERKVTFEALQQTVALYERGMLVQSAATSESTLSQYEVGKVTFATVLETNAGYIADQEGYLQAVAAAHRLLIAEEEVSLGTSGSAPATIGGSVPGAGNLNLESAGQGTSTTGAAAAPASATMSGM